MNRVLGALAIAACATACGNAHPSANRGEVPTVSQDVPLSTSTRFACDIADKAKIISSLNQYIVPGTVIQNTKPNHAHETDEDGDSLCDYDWTPRPQTDPEDDAPTGLTIHSRKYSSGAHKDAESVIAEARQHGGFTPVTASDIRPGAVFEKSSFRVAGTHGYFYDVFFGGWLPGSQIMPSFEAMARAIANADQ
jgi:hypothetical protein